MSGTIARDDRTRLVEGEIVSSTPRRSTALASPGGGSAAFLSRQGAVGTSHLDQGRTNSCGCPGDDAEDEHYKGTPEGRPVFDFSYDGVMRSVEKRKDRLGLDRVDVLLRA